MSGLPIVVSLGGATLLSVGSTVGSLIVIKVIIRITIKMAALSRVSLRLLGRSLVFLNVLLVPETTDGINASKADRSTALLGDGLVIDWCAVGGVLDLVELKRAHSAESERLRKQRFRPANQGGHSVINMHV